MTGGRTFTFAALPNNVQQLMALPEYAMQTPFETAALCVLCMIAYTNDTKSGIEMINAIKGPQPLSAYETQFLRDRLFGNAHVPLSYLGGTSPQNNYTPAVPYTITVQENPYSYTEQGYATLYLQSSGADSMRPIKLRQKGQQWFLWENLLMASIRKPAKDDPWA